MHFKCFFSRGENSRGTRKTSVFFFPSLLLSSLLCVANTSTRKTNMETDMLPVPHGKGVKDGVTLGGALHHLMNAILYADEKHPERREYAARVVLRVCLSNKMMPLFIFLRKFELDNVSVYANEGKEMAVQAFNEFKEILEDISVKRKEKAPKHEINGMLRKARQVCIKVVLRMCDSPKTHLVVHSLQLAGMEMEKKERVEQMYREAAGGVQQDVIRVLQSCPPKSKENMHILEVYATGLWRMCTAKREAYSYERWRCAMRFLYGVVALGGENVCRRVLLSAVARNKEMSDKNEDGVMLDFLEHMSIEAPLEILSGASIDNFSLGEEHAARAICVRALFVILFGWHEDDDTVEKGDIHERQAETKIYKWVTRMDMRKWSRMESTAVKVRMPSKCAALVKYEDDLMEMVAKMEEEVYKGYKRDVTDGLVCVASIMREESARLYEEKEKILGDEIALGLEKLKKSGIFEKRHPLSEKERLETAARASGGKWGNGLLCKTSEVESAAQEPKQVERPSAVKESRKRKKGKDERVEPDHENKRPREKEQKQELEELYICDSRVLAAKQTDCKKPTSYFCTIDRDCELAHLGYASVLVHGPYKGAKQPLTKQAVDRIKFMLDPLGATLPTTGVTVVRMKVDCGLFRSRKAITKARHGKTMLFTVQKDLCDRPPIQGVGVDMDSVDMKQYDELRIVAESTQPKDKSRVHPLQVIHNRRHDGHAAVPFSLSAHSSSKLTMRNLCASVLFRSALGMPACELGDFLVRGNLVYSRKESSAFSRHTCVPKRDNLLSDLHPEEKEQIMAAFEENAEWLKTVLCKWRECFLNDALFRNMLDPALHKSKGGKEKGKCANVVHNCENLLSVCAPPDE